MYNINSGSKNGYTKGRKFQPYILEKIEILTSEPLKAGNPLKGNLQGYRSIRSVGQRYKIIYRVKGTEIEIIVAFEIKRDDDKKNDIYELMKKYVKIGLLKDIGKV